MHQGSLALIAVFSLSGLARAAAPSPVFLLQPLCLQEQRESVYAPPTPLRENDGVNQGAVHTELAVRYLTDYVFRGIERFEFDPGFPRDPASPPRPPIYLKKTSLICNLKGRSVLIWASFPARSLACSSMPPKMATMATADFRKFGRPSGSTGT